MGKFIDFMNKNKEFIPREDIEIAVIAPDGTTYIADRSSNGKKMKEKLLEIKETSPELEEMLSQKNYKEHECCRFHINYVQLLILHLLKVMPELKQHENSLSVFPIYEILHDNNYLIISNMTSYEGILLSLHGKSAAIIPPKNHLTKEQIKSLHELRNKEIFNEFETIRIAYLDPRKTDREFNRFREYDAYTQALVELTSPQRTKRLARLKTVKAPHKQVAYNQ